MDMFCFKGKKLQWLLTMNRFFFLKVTELAVIGHFCCSHTTASKNLWPVAWGLKTVWHQKNSLYEEDCCSERLLGHWENSHQMNPSREKDSLEWCFDLTPCLQPVDDSDVVESVMSAAKRLPCGWPSKRLVAAAIWHLNPPPRLDRPFWNRAASWSSHTTSHLWKASPLLVGVRPHWPRDPSSPNRRRSCFVSPGLGDTGALMHH